MGIFEIWVSISQLIETEVLLIILYFQFKSGFGKDDKVTVNKEE